MTEPNRVTPELAECAVMGRFVAYVRVADRPGAVVAVAEVVSSRGVSMESLASGDVADGEALLTLVFRTSRRLLRLIERTLGRLAAVSDVLVLASDDPRVLAAGVVYAGPHPLVPPDDALVTWSGDASPGRPLLFQGALVEVEKVLDAARAQGARQVTSVLLPP